MWWACGSAGLAWGMQEPRPVGLLSDTQEVGWPETRLQGRRGRLWVTWKRGGGRGSCPRDATLPPGSSPRAAPSTQARSSPGDLEAQVSRDGRLSVGHWQDGRVGTAREPSPG